MPAALIHSVRIFDGESTISATRCILIEDGLIHSILPSTSFPLPAAEITIGGIYNTILPGLIDAHVHPHEGVGELQQALRLGVTTVGYF